MIQRSSAERSSATSSSTKEVPGLRDGSGCPASLVNSPASSGRLRRRCHRRRRKRRIRLSRRAEIIPTEAPLRRGGRRVFRPAAPAPAGHHAVRRDQRVAPVRQGRADARRRAGAASRQRGDRAARVQREVWSLTPHLCAVNSKPDLIANIGRALARGLTALAP